MGTVVTVCMLLTVLFATRLPAGWAPALQPNRITPPNILRIVGWISIAAGLWNVLWYGLRHLGEFWGHMALGSGVLMTLLGAMLIVPTEKLPAVLNKLRPFAALGLLGFAYYYGQTIYRL